MSVINKMLRDLDKRNAVEVANKGPAGMGSLRKGTASVERFRPEQSDRAQRVVVWGGAAALVAAAVAGAFWWTRVTPPNVPPTPQLASVPVPATSQPLTQAAPPLAVPASAPVVAAVPDAAASAAVATPAAAGAPPPVTPAVQAATAVPAAAAAPAVQAAPTAPAAQVAPLPAAAPAVAASRTSPAAPVKAPAAAPAAKASAPAAAAPASPAAAAAQASSAAKPQIAAAAIDPVQLAQRQQQLGREALAHAQTLWTSGSRDLAIDLLQQAETAAERASQNSPMPSNTQHLSVLVRELTRMLLAQGRAAAALEMLVRVEPQLAGEAEIWATRANVAQRLGRHQDSVLAYTVALQSRPAEQRWLLGAAVSLAALGQTAQAAEMAEKARLGGPISKEVQAYLRQMGVNLKDQ